ncbi:MAG TPA: hypothetical protein VHJ58_10925 [Vicinamibacterales bacterium]|nr:hypothetical protein [Vicinamibacterales bacterium]
MREVIFDVIFSRATMKSPAVVPLMAVCCGWISMSAVPRAPSDVGVLVTQIAERVARYYGRAQSLICIEHSVVQPIGRTWSWEGLARTVESELRVESEASDGARLPEARVIRNVRRINGRAPNPRDKTDRSGCTDPRPLSPEPLAFLLPAHRDGYRFTSVREGKEDDRAALVIDYTSTIRKSRPELIEDELGHDDCFDWSGPVATRGRVWVDASTYDVLRVERRLAGPIDVRVPWALQRRYLLPPWVVVEQDDLTIRYKPVIFTDPHEVILLPESSDSLTIVRGSLQSVRRSERFSGYRRFLTGGRIVSGR